MPQLVRGRRAKDRHAVPAITSTSRSPSDMRTRPMPRYSLPGKTVLLTGAAGGIGAASARALHARGANIVLVGRNLSAVTVLAHELGDRRALPLSVDVTDPAALRNAVIRAVDRFGALDVVFANAGVAPKAPATIAGIDPELFEHIVEVDLLGVWRTVRAALPQVIAHRGHVLVTASIYAYVNGAANAPYAASKAAVEQFARALRVELAMHQATAGILYPGWVHTPMSRPAFGGDEFTTRMRTAAFPRPLAAAVTPEAVARRVVRGIERRAPSITAPRRWQPVGMLRGLVNPLVDRALIRHRTLQPLLRAVGSGAQDGGITAAPPAREEGSGQAPCAEGRDGRPSAPAAAPDER
ncbi:short-chain dehydrogenase/reductase [Streptomyces sp. TRM 70351]|uniref:short-chain dehydrogenase/reductase n=1 Tax=Streptomyces sp. TRM 70351 TaxID=3116552 RepID=UPI002E7BDE25|nr:short-chain dehydrogenase/reductase [Streptomyces sp. TRM 70351]MEE1930833.1 short-chain dehydrogenase/reductase [Streptomyces sp. TRM 70351]